MTTRDPMRARATQMLVLATLFWGLSFPVMKAMALAQMEPLAGRSSWFATASVVTVRFGAAAVITFVWTLPSLRGLTFLEFWQGFGLGALSGAGMLFQIDGLSYTSASTSAFLTQCSCLLLPWVAALRERRWPEGRILICSLLAGIGVAVLADFHWRQFTMGRGELETLASSVIFTGQILWLDRPKFASNRVRHFSLVMFVTMSLLGLPLALLTQQRPGDWALAYDSRFVWICVGVLVFFCTMIAFVLMNRWQRFLPAAEAGLIYAAEPVFASLFALWLPGWLSRISGIPYANETATPALLLGGGLITSANILIQVQARRARRVRRVPEGKFAPTPQ